MVKVLHIITNLHIGGAEHLLVDLLPLLQKETDVELLVFDGVRTSFYEELESRGITIHSLGQRDNVYDIRNILLLRKFIEGYDIIHTHNTAPQFFVPLALCLKHCSCPPVLITTEHSTSNRRRNMKIFKYLDRWMYRQYKKIICVSDISSNNIIDYVGDPHIMTETIPNGINYSKFATASPNEDILQRYKTVHKGIMIAGFRYEKDQPTVIRAYSLLPDNYHLFLVGDGERRSELELLSSNLGCKERIHFLGKRSDIPSLLKASDVVILSSHREGLSLSSIEGMASGRPFIASDVDGLHEVVGDYGLLFPHQDAKALSDIIIKLSTDSSFADSVSARCLLRAKQYDVSVMASRYKSLYDSCLINSNE